MASEKKQKILKIVATLRCLYGLLTSKNIKIPNHGTPSTLQYAIFRWTNGGIFKTFPVVLKIWICLMGSWGFIVIVNFLVMVGESLGLITVLRLTTGCFKKNATLKNDDSLPLKSFYVIKNHQVKYSYHKIYTIGYYSGFYSSLREKI